MRKFLIACLASLLTFSASAAEKPNILIIFTDDQGWNDVGCYGSKIPTPNIDRLAAEGLRFTRFYAASAICTPSRFGLLTGRNPSRSHDQLLSALMFMSDEHRDMGIQADETTIAEVLRRDAGYHTALIGKWHLGHGDARLLPLANGFDHFIGHTGGCIDFFTMTYGNIPDWYHDSQLVSENGYATDLISAEAINFLEQQSEKKSAPPFFLHLAYNAPHFGKGWDPSKKETVNLMQPDTGTIKRAAEVGFDDKVRREFAAMTISLDDGVGQVLDTLESTGLADNTLVVFQTDHGGDPTYGGSNLPLRGEKATLFEGGIRVPCIARWPGKVEAGSVISNAACALDWFPTFCAAAGIEAPRNLPLDGQNLLPQLTGKNSDAKPREFFWELGAHAELERSPWSALINGDWKYLDTPKQGEFLFNLHDDPHEEHNLAESQGDRLTTMRTRRDGLHMSYRE